MEILQAEHMVTMIRRALNMVDARLMDHGMRVALLVNAMLESAGITDAGIRKNMGILALLHDIGAYQTEEIDRMVDFETENIWEHSIYGYLVLKEFTPLGGWARVILYHHAAFGQFPDEPEDIMYYAGILHIADRVDVYWQNSPGRNLETLRKILEKKSGETFDPKAVELFWRAERDGHLTEALDRPVSLRRVIDERAVTAEEARNFLRLLVLSIDFRSRYTVTHTVNTMRISMQLAERMGLGKGEQEKIGYGALLHDMGKLWVPPEILEKPGRLTLQEMEIMRRHVEKTREIIEGCVEEDVLHIAVRHHEKLDGTGYPEGLSAAELSTEERIVAVADITSALWGTRSYKDAFPKDRILRILKQMGEEGKLDERIVRKTEEEFDSIMEETEKEAAPILHAYETLSREYAGLSARLLEERAE